MGGLSLGWIQADGSGAVAPRAQAGSQNQSQRSEPDVFDLYVRRAVVPHRDGEEPDRLGSGEKQFEKTETPSRAHCGGVLCHSRISLRAVQNHGARGSVSRLASQ